MNREVVKVTELRHGDRISGSLQHSPCATVLRPWDDMRLVLNFDGDHGVSTVGAPADVTYARYEDPSLIPPARRLTQLDWSHLVLLANSLRNAARDLEDRSKGYRAQAAVKEISDELSALVDKLSTTD